MKDVLNYVRQKVTTWNFPEGATIQLEMSVSGKMVKSFIHKAKEGGLLK